ncbi:MAG: T9SS type A sorting domain-containing protein [Bacteroidota bacterium]
MKKVLVFLLLACFSVSVPAQMITVSVPVLTANPGETVNVPVVIVSGASSSGTPIGACDVNINYDDEVLTYIGLTNFYANMPAGEWIYSGNLSMVAANWIDGALLTEAIPDGTVLFEMQFTYNGGNSPLTFSKNEFYDVDYLLIPTTPLNGAVNSNTVSHEVTFMVDMSREVVSPEGVHLAGSFNNWNYSANPMISEADGIYSATLPLEENSTYTYRFVNGNTSAGLEEVPASCGVINGSGEYERELVLTAEPMVTDTVCFSSCENCPLLHTVTFRVDMINQDVSVNGVHLAGTFNNWDYSATEMILTGGGAEYQVTLQLEQGQYYEYKFVNGNNAVNAEIVPGGCSNNGNRYLTVPASELTLDAFCFAECVECGSVPEFFDITFRVDMTNETVSPEGVHIAGSFQGWQPGTSPMVSQGNNIYTYTTTLLEGTSTEYLYVNGNTTAGYETVPEQCSMNGNRFFNSISADTLLPEVCFSSCDTCQLPEVMVTFRVDMSGEGVIISPDGVHLAGSFQGWDPAATEMTADVFDMYSVMVSLPVGSYLEYRFVNGNTEAGYESVPVDCSAGNNRYFTVPEMDTLLTGVCFASCEPCPTGVYLGSSPGKSFRIYPNPSQDNINLDIELDNESEISVSVVNSLGTCVMATENIHYHPGSHSVTLPANNLPVGIYMVLLSDKRTLVVSKEKLVISR